MAAMPPAKPVQQCDLQAEAARSGWQASESPASGWTPVTLPDDWATRWPDFDGVVWYRLTWMDDCAAGRPLALWVDFLNMAGAVYLNGTLLDRDEHLVEPLSRSWNTPRYWLLPAPLLNRGMNTVLVRVSGLAAYQPGLGNVIVGDRTTVRPLYQHAIWMRHDLQIFSLAITSTLSCFFLVLWLMRRRETMYGWFSLQSLAWWCFAFNQIATSTWPFSSTDTWESVSSILFVAYSACFTMFVVRFCELRLPRIEATLWILVACQTIAMLAAPHAYVTEVRAAIALIPVITFMASCIAFIAASLRSKRTDQLALSLCMALFVAAGTHDLLTFLGMLGGNFYYTPLTAQIEVVAMALVLAWRFVNNLRRIENFSGELTAKITAAKEDLRTTLHRQHELEIANARLNERLNLAYNLHDGLGSTLVSNIVTLEQSPHGMPAERFLIILKELRDDLRGIIDIASIHQSGSGSLSELIAPLRHRLTRAFEAQGMDCHWQLAGLDGLHLSDVHCIDVIRIVQEALTNVLRHSGASRVEINLINDGPALRLVISDNGRGFDPVALATHEGTGMRSMRARVSRLNGTLQVQSTRAGTVLQISIAGIGDGQTKTWDRVTNAL